MPPRLPVAISLARPAITSLAFMFVEVPAAGLEDVDDELVVELAVDHLLRRLLEQLAAFSSSRPELVVHLRRRPLDQPHRGDEPAAKAQVGDREILHRPAGLTRRSRRRRGPSSRPSSLFRCGSCRACIGASRLAAAATRRRCADKSPNLRRIQPHVGFISTYSTASPTSSQLSRNRFHPPRTHGVTPAPSRTSRHRMDSSSSQHTHRRGTLEETDQRLHAFPMPLRHQMHVIFKDCATRGVSHQAVSPRSQCRPRSRVAAPHQI